MNKKGNIQTLYPTILALILVGVLMGAGLMILGQFKGTMTASSAEANATGSVVTSLGALATTWLPVIVVVIAAGIVLSILLGAFGGSGKRK